MSEAARPMGRFVWSNMILMAGAAAYWFSRKDDDDYKTKPGWLRNGYITFALFGRDDLRIKKGYGLPKSIWNFTESTLDSFFGDRPEALAEFVEHELGAEAFFLPGDLVNRLPVVSTLVETTANRDFFKDRPIESLSMEHRNPWNRYDETTDELSKWLGYYTGKTIGISPKKLHFGVNDVTGGMYNRSLEYMENVSRVVTGEAKDVGEYIKAIPGSKAFLIQKGKTRDMNDFYNKNKELRLKAGDIKFTGGAQDQELIKEQALSNRYQTIIGEIRKLQRKEDYGGKTWYYFQTVLIGAAREGLGRSSLESYRSPFDPEALLTPEIQDARNNFVRLMRVQARTGNPKKAYAQFEKPGRSDREALKMTLIYVQLRRQAAQEWLFLNHKRNIRED